MGDMVWIRLLLVAVGLEWRECGGWGCVSRYGASEWWGHSSLHMRKSSPSSGCWSAMWGPINAVVSGDTKFPDAAMGFILDTKATLERWS